MPSINLKGLDELFVKLNGLSDKLEQSLSDSVKVVAIKVQNEAILSIREPSVGKSVTRYTDSGNPFSHIQSVKGDAPNNDTGRLIGSIEMLHKNLDLNAFVFTNLEYGFLLETVHDRPFLQPALNSQSDNLLKTLNLSIKKVIENAG